MDRRRVMLILWLLCASIAQTAHAFFDPPWITPTTPKAGEVVSVNIRGGGCDAIFERPGYPQITRSGNAVRLVEYGDRAPGGWCIYDIGTLNEPIGAFPPGHYTATVDFAYDDYPFGIAITALGVVSFTVTGAAPAASVPVATPLWKLVLLVLISGIAARTLQMRQRGNLGASRDS